MTDTHQPLTMSDDEFSELLSTALDSLPEDRVRGLQNVAIIYADEPTAEQRNKLHLRCDQTLFGLYEGIPLTKRAAATGLFSGMPMTMPDVITIFKRPILAASRTKAEVAAQVRHTLWHEIAHYYGLDHDQIDKLEH